MDLERSARKQNKWPRKVIDISSLIPDRDKRLASYVLIRKIALKGRSEKKRWRQKIEKNITQGTTLFHKEHSTLTSYFALRSGRRRKVKVKWKVKRGRRNVEKAYRDREANRARKKDPLHERGLILESGGLSSGNQTFEQAPKGS